MCPGTATTQAPSLYGITNSNRTGRHLWGKNEFNSTFPTALACYMRDRGIRVVYLKLEPDLRVIAVEITVDELFNTNLPNNQLRFEFETRFEPYQQYDFNEISGFNLVVRNQGDAKLSPIQ